MDRANEILTPATAPWLNTPGVQTVCEILRARGHAIYFVGGCVRNALLGEPVSDIDLSTDARPDEIMSLAEQAGLKAIPTGFEHGTVTVVAEGHPFEITTFRRDIETDGRRAVVAFSDNMVDDARRRDFTMNALYATSSGEVVDPLGGLADLRARRIRFIDDAEARIREDYLRILRFFRFHARYASPDHGLDPDALSAITQNSAGLETLSAERVGAEMRKLLGARNPSPAVAAMRQTGVLHVVLPGADDKLLAPVIHVEDMLALPIDWILRLVALGGENVGDRLRLSRSETRKLDLLREIAFAGPDLAEVAYRYGEETGMQVLALQSAVAEQPPSEDEIEKIRNSALEEFPITAKDLHPAYVGPALGQRLKKLEQRWIASGFALGRADLLDLPDD